ncbi:hypothetical protein HJFPF1_00598 [Paramyrothecium foliicola]|nr:hypothetical protein HJFPF1_00598 [Paramyrothecium foliicola]
MLSAVKLPERPPPTPLGHRRGISDLASFAIDLNRPIHRAEPPFSAHYNTYPSPPMSGSPHLPPKGAREASDRGLAPSVFLDNNPQNARRGSLTHSLGQRDQLPSPLSTSQTYPQEQQGSMGAGTTPGNTSCASSGIEFSELPAHVQFEYAVVSTTKPARFDRDTRRHIAQFAAEDERPCSFSMRAVQTGPFTVRWYVNKPTQGSLALYIQTCNGKEDACVDVKHKKRGRPRLRDDRETRYDPSRFPHPQDVALRRPLNIYPSGGSGSPGEPMTPRFLERASLSDANVYTTPLSIATRIPIEAVAYLTLDLEFSKASPTFLDALGNVNIIGRKLADTVVSNEIERAVNIRNQLLSEQKRKEPNYLPPILGRGDQIIQALGFTADAIARFQLDHQDYLTFAADGHPRPHHVRFGLAEEGSFFFVVMVLGIRYPPTFSPGYDMERPRLDPGPPTQHAPAMVSPGYGVGGGSHYVPSSSRLSYSSPHFEASMTTQHPPQPPFHLPPIRNQSSTAAIIPNQAPRRTERSSRVDIGGLIDKPEEKR